MINPCDPIYYPIYYVGTVGLHSCDEHQVAVEITQQGEVYVSVDGSSFYLISGPQSPILIPLTRMESIIAQEQGD